MCRDLFCDVFFLLLRVHHDLHGLPSAVKDNSENISLLYCDITPLYLNLSSLVISILSILGPESKADALSAIYNVIFQIKTYRQTTQFALTFVCVERPFIEVFKTSLYVFFETNRNISGSDY